MDDAEADKFVQLGIGQLAFLLGFIDGIDLGDMHQILQGFAHRLAGQRRIVGRHGKAEAGEQTTGEVRQRHDAKIEVIVVIGQQRLKLQVIGAEIIQRLQLQLPE